MGNSLRCISQDQEQNQKKPTVVNGGGESSNSEKHVRRLSLIPSFRRRTLLPSLSCAGSSTSGSSTSKKGGVKTKKKIRERHHQEHHHHDNEKDSRIQEQTLAATNVLFSQTPRNSNSAPPFRRSTSVVYPSSQPPPSAVAAVTGSVSGVLTPKKSTCGFVRSSSNRQRSSTDPVLKPNQLLDKELKVEGADTKRFVLVHGGGFGAWCWYKTITLLEKHGFQVDAVDLTGSGVSSFDTNNITSLAQYVKPLLHFFDTLKPTEKVILVGHDFGGACMSYAMEMFPSKISKAVFISAAMLANGQSTLDLFNQQPESSHDLMEQVHLFLYANGKKSSPTAVDFDRSLLRDFFFNQSPPKDVALASVSMRPIPFAPVIEKLHVSEKNYGSIRRFYIKTMEDDYAVPVCFQDAMIKSNPPEQVFQLKGSDHAPFFSRPQSLNRILVEISQIPSKKSS
ncbi:PREDICTED: putative methylesterase 15, chloroplastic [Brassica oleracea var. oleracea]|uniref:AB hydrolase-1 domain-containing protein n=1 Tax=Brassica oleracea var. oleracea TaxID=109376 RepID=A0A0D3AP89_BRAOL|nr:PREDICTED: putative methylesterase 15, chloroplastic [Brassica oleracea var. oleracea]